MARITRILVPADFSATSDAALTYAQRLAEQFGASLHLVHAFEDPFTAAAFAAEMYTPLPLSMRDAMLRDAQQRLDDRLPAEQQARFEGTTAILAGQPATVILDRAKATDASVIVMGTHGRGGMAHLLLGSVAERVVRHAPCPVLTIREAPARSTKRILVPTDFSPTSDAALEFALPLAERLGASLHLLHVLDDPFVADGLSSEAYMTEAPTLRTAMLQDAQERLAHRASPTTPGVARIETEVLFGHGAKTIAEYAAAREVDLIVMGTHGRTGVAHFLLGSVAERLVRTAPCPVLTVRQPKARRHDAAPDHDVERLPA